MQSYFLNGGVVGSTLSYNSANYYQIGIPRGETAYTTPGTYSFVVPAGVTSVSGVAVGGGGGGAGGDGGRGEPNMGGGGGGLAYGTLAVTPGETLTVVVGAAGSSVTGGNGTLGGASSIARGATVLLSGGGGAGGQERSTAAASGGAISGTNLVNGGAGGAGGAGTAASGGSGGGGAGGYSAAGGAGGTSTGGSGANATGGGGAGGAGRTGTTAAIAWSGGGVGILGTGANGTGGTAAAGGGGSGGAAGTTNGGLYGGGGGARTDSSGAGYAGGAGAVRLIWGSGRTYPSTLTADGAGSGIVNGNLKNSGIWSLQAAFESIYNYGTSAKSLTFSSVVDVGGALTTTHTCTAVDPNPNRILIAVIVMGGATSSSISSVTIGGIAATRRAGRTANDFVQTDFWSAIVPTGTSVNVVVTKNTGTNSSSVSLITANGYANTNWVGATNFNASNTSTALMTATATFAAGSTGIAIYRGENIQSSATRAWTNLSTLGFQVLNPETPGVGTSVANDLNVISCQYQYNLPAGSRTVSFTSSDTIRRRPSFALIGFT